MSKQLSQSQAMRYNRQIMLAGFDLERQEMLLNAKVLQIGVGGLGCASAQYLVAAGIGQLTLVDDDQVELTNLQRQILHNEADIGISKVQSAVDSLNQLNSDCQLIAIAQRLADPQLTELICQHDLVLDCSDNLATRNQLNRLCVTNKIPLVCGAAIRMEGQITSIIPGGDNPCYQCLSQFFAEQQLSCVEAGVMAPLVGIIGAMQALEAIKIITAYGQNLAGKLMLLDGKTHQWQSFNLVKDPHCKLCGHSPNEN
ncbi:molybdopterin-synthase adenylyltransferase MoeB [Neptunicella sp. SCSIO 80796]|uniref:molybdopterin-synthase adenylyltransferase MoeB n=1 Tax=Neptunicella plasticusilytica TaxID=3117012 RepID=UPI003A4D8B96